MASPASAPAGVQSFLTSDEGSIEYNDSLNTVSEQLRGSQLTILDLVKALADVLTSTNDSTRTRGALLLAEVIDVVPAALDSVQDAHHLAVFFASRVSDWPSLRPALKGCLALVQQRGESPARCTSADAVEIARALLAVNVRSLTVVDRQLCLHLLLALAKGYGTTLVGTSLKLLEGAAAALDGERDPRCLLAGFSAIQAFAELYAHSGEAAAKGLEEHAEELMDVLGCYFPIVYTPPADTKGKVTRGELVAGVERALSAAPALAPYVIPMLLEKLSSSLRQAQEDALSALAVCTTGYGAAATEQHLPKIWEALRGTLTAPGEPDLAAEDAIKVQELAGKAQACLRECARSLATEGNTQLVDLVLDDGIMRDLLDDVADAGQRGGFAGAFRRSQAALPVLAAVAGSSLLGSTRVSQRLLGSLIRLTAAAQSSDSRQLGLRAVLCLVSSTRDAVTDVHARAPRTGTAEALSASVHANGQPAVSVSSQPGSSTSDSRDIASLLAGRGADVLQLALGTESAGKQAALNSEDMEDDELAGDVARSAQEAGVGELDPGGAPGSEERAGEETENLTLQLQVLAELATFPKAGSPLSQTDQQQALQRLLEYVYADSVAESSTPAAQAQLKHLSTGNQEAVSNLVCSALEGMARAGYADLLAGSALPCLYAAASLPEPKPSISGVPVPRVERGSELSSSQEAGAAQSHSSGRHTGEDSVALQALASVARASRELRTPILAAFVAGIPAALAAAAAKDGSHHSPLLMTLSDEKLLAGDNEAAERVVLQLFKGVNALFKAKSSISGAALHDAATLSQVATSVCSGTRDAKIARAACSTVTSGAASLATRPHAEVAQEVAPAAAALAVLPAAFAAEEARLQMLRALLELALGMEDNFAASTVAAAAASAINKTPKDEVDRAVAVALDDILLPQIAQKGKGCKRALMCLGQLSKALVMRGHARFQDILRAALKLSHDLTLAQPASADITMPTGEATAAEAAQVFGSLLEIDESRQLNRPSQIFGKGRVLWQQRAFTVAADLLIQGNAAPSRGTIYCLERLLSAANRSAPAVVRAGYDRVLPATLTSLVALSTFGDVSDDGAADSLLQQVQLALATPQGQAVLEGELDRLIPLCAERTLSTGPAAHRANAVRALESLAAYPYHLLHPFRPQVLAALSKAVDDRKRAVRAAAVRCRRKWGVKPM